MTQTLPPDLPPDFLPALDTPPSNLMDRFLTDEGRRIATAVAALRPLIRAEAAEAERRGRLSDALVARFAEIGLYRTAAPKEYGGLALGARDIAEIARELGRSDAAAGWTFLVACSLRMVSTFPPSMVDEMYSRFDSHPGPLAAGGSTFAAVTGTARRGEGGWLVKGKWTFVSGNHHASWIFGGVHWGDGDRKGNGLIMMDKSQLETLDDWHVAGMAASDSNTLIAAEEIFVPDSRFIDMADLPKYMDSADARYTGLAYQAKAMASMMTVMVLNISTLVGMAHGCFDLFVEQAGKRRPFSPPVYGSVAEMASTQVAAGKARAMIDAAEAIVLKYADWIDQLAADGADFAPPDESQGSLDLSYVGHLCLEAMELMERILGSSTATLSNPIQRFVRDARVITSHGALRLEPLSEISGRWLLGLQPFDMFAAGLQNKGGGK